MRKAITLIAGQFVRCARRHIYITTRMMEAFVKALHDLQRRRWHNSLKAGE